MDTQNSLVIQAPDPFQNQVSTPTGSRSTKRAPQHTVDHFWGIFSTKYPGRVSNILPENVHAKSKAAHEPKGIVHGQSALKSYKETVADCIAAVDKIAKECRRVNMRYRDPHFDIEFDLKWNQNDCLEGLVPGEGDAFAPNSVKRVPEIFDDPQFTIDDATASDVRQGNDGDCWLLAALCAISYKPGLIDRVCVAKDPQVGVYGFVFHRDGEWSFTVIDDKLYLNSTDYDESNNERFSWDQVFNRQDAEEEYRKAYQTGSRALYFAQCSTENETWVPLLEKAFAKAHGDYRAIYGGFTGEAIEDLTGGVTTELFTSDILDKDKFWTDELMQVNKEFLFGCATGWFDEWKGRKYDHTDRKGVVPLHAYSIMEAKEIQGQRLLKVRNPWGKTEWQGPWSDGSAEWTPEWMHLLDHKFGNDGIFWIHYDDLRRKYQSFDRTRLFGDEWSVTQKWTTVDVPWSADYNDTKFTITTVKKGPLVIVLSQLDERYFRGLQGQYVFSLHFRLDKVGEHDYVCRSHGNYLMNRSVSADLELEPGTYSVLMKITAKRYESLPTPQDTIRGNCKTRQEKLVQIGLAYDLAHARGQFKESDAEIKTKAEKEEKARTAFKKKQREEAREAKYKEWLIHKKEVERNRRHKKRLEEHKRRKAEAQKRAAGPEESETKKDGQPAKDAPAASPDAGGQAGQTQDAQPIRADNPPPPTLPTTNGVLENPAAPDAGLTSTKDVTTQAKIDQFNKDLEAMKASNPSPAVPPANASAPGSVSFAFDDTASVLSFCSSIVSDLDYEPQDPNVDQANLDQGNPDQVVEKEIDEENVEFANDPWNAVCVVGLRIFSKDNPVTICVVRPKVGKGEEETPLDVDDPSKGISEEVIPAVEGVVGKGVETNGVVAADERDKLDKASAEEKNADTVENLRAGKEADPKNVAEKEEGVSHSGPVVAQELGTEAGTHTIEDKVMPDTKDQPQTIDQPETKGEPQVKAEPQIKGKAETNGIPETIDKSATREEPEAKKEADVKEGAGTTVGVEITDGAETTAGGATS